MPFYKPNRYNEAIRERSNITVYVRSAKKFGRSTLMKEYENSEGEYSINQESEISNMESEWIINHDMDDENGNPTQWLNTELCDNGMIDKIDDYYLICVYYDKLEDIYGCWHYFETKFKTLEEAIDFANAVWGGR